MDMLIQAFSSATLQNCRALLLSRDAEEVVADVIKAIDDHLAIAHAAIDLEDRRVRPPTQLVPPICPDCPRGARMRWAVNHDGLQIAVCPECRYSEVV